MNVLNTVFNKKIVATLGLAALIIVISVSVFLFFKAFFDLDINPFVTEILAAFLGTILFMLVTLLLLRSQSDQDLVTKRKDDCMLKYSSRKCNCATISLKNTIKRVRTTNCP